MSEIQEILTRFWDQLIAQPHGPLAFRLILQPLMATFFAIRDGLKDARAGRPLYTWSILTDPAHRADYLREGLKRVSQSYRLCACDGRDLSIPCFALVLPGRSAGHRVRACGAPLYSDSRAGSAPGATLAPARCALR